MYAMRTAYESVNAAELARDLKEELTDRLAGSLEGGQKAAGETQSYRNAYFRPRKKLPSRLSTSEMTRNLRLMKVRISMTSHRQWSMKTKHQGIYI